MSEKLPNPAHVDVETVEQHLSSLKMRFDTQKRGCSHGKVHDSTEGGAANGRAFMAAPRSATAFTPVQGSRGDTTSHGAFSREGVPRLSIDKEYPIRPSMPGGKTPYTDVANQELYVALTVLSGAYLLVKGCMIPTTGLRLAAGRSVKPPL